MDRRTEKKAGPPAARESVLAAIIVAVCALYPPVWSLAVLGPKAIFGHLAADSFYYFTIARNALDGVFPSFDGVRPTNGFHPLWQIVLTGAFRLVGRDQEAQLTCAFLLSVVFVTGGIVLFALAVRRLTSSSLAALWLVPGIFSLAFSVHAIQTKDIGLTYTSSIWAFMNGMESSLSILLGGALVWLLVAAPPRDDAGRARRDLGLGVVLALAALARLDDIFLAVAFAGWFAFAKPREPGRWARAMRVGAPAAIALAGYLVWSRVQTGMWVPVSTAFKSGPMLVSNLTILAADFFPPAFGPHVLGQWVGTAQRLILIVGPVVFAAVLLVRLRGASRPSSLAPFAPLFVYVVLKSVITLATIRLTQQGYWYFALFVALFNFGAVVALHSAVARGGRGAAVLASTAWVVAFLFSSANGLHRVAEPNWWYDVWAKRDEMRRELLALRPNAKLVEFYDGLFAYSLDLPTIAATGHVLDRGGRDAARRKMLPEYSLELGYDIAVTAPKSYPIFPDWLKNLERRPVFRHEETGVAFAELRPRGGIVPR